MRHCNKVAQQHITKREQNIQHDIGYCVDSQGKMKNIQEHMNALL